MRREDYTAADWPVGDRVWIRSVNRRYSPDEEATIVKVGRTLVHVENRWRQVFKFRIENGVVADNYGHESIETGTMRAEREAYEADLETLATAGLRRDAGTHDRALIAAVAAAIRTYYDTKESS